MTPSLPQAVTVSPSDEHNRRLVTYVHPPNWQNPQPQGCYDLVVIGAGTAGLVAAAGAAGLGIGLKVALVEKHLMGGDCLNFGCVPSKAIIRSSRVIGELRRSPAYGIEVKGTVDINFDGVMARMREIRADISHHDSAKRFAALGIDVFLGSATFTAGDSLKVGEQTLRFKKAVIATGARAFCPQIEGLPAAGYLTNETVFSLTTRPERLAVIGGGPIGCELAQAFQRLGSQVTLLHNHFHLLNKEAPEAAAIVQKALIEDGVTVVTNVQLQSVETTPQGKKLHYRRGDADESLVVDEILIGAGRSPNVQGLGLEAIGVEYDARRGVKVNDYLQTSHPNIYAAGDICMAWKFTHAADAAARIVIKNTLFAPFGLGKAKLSDLVMPWVTYTDPEIAHVGLDEDTAKNQGIAYNAITIPLAKVDRAITDGETNGFLKLLHAANSDRILGATIVAPHAGDMISEITTAIVGKLGLNTLSTVIHPYPTQAEAIKKAADAYRRTLLTPRSRFFLKWLSKFSSFR